MVGGEQLVRIQDSVKVASVGTKKQKPLSGMGLDMDLALTGKVVLVSGGSRGIGEAIVRSFVAEGARVANVNLAGSEGHRTRDRGYRPFPCLTAIGLHNGPFRP